MDFNNAAQDVVHAVVPERSHQALASERCLPCEHAHIPPSRVAYGSGGGLGAGLVGQAEHFR